MDRDIKIKLSESLHWPPWTDLTLFTITDLTKINKISSNVKMIKAYFNEIRNNYEDNLLFFTDGSKIQESCSCAIYCPKLNITRKFKLNKNLSIFTAETIAVNKAVEMAISFLPKKSIIITDSLSVIKSFENIHTKNCYIKDIQKNVVLAKYKIKLLWVPSHSSIQGNEMADRLAREAHLEQIIYNFDLDKEFLKQLYTNLKKNIIDKWQNSGKSMVSMNRNLEKQTPPQNLSKREKQIIKSLRIGHTRITHQHLLVRYMNATECRFCGQTLDVNHIITCNNPDVMKEVLVLTENGKNDDILNYNNPKLKKIFTFLKNLNLDTQI